MLGCRPRKIVVFPDLGPFWAGVYTMKFVYNLLFFGPPYPCFCRIMQKGEMGIKKETNQATSRFKLFTDRRDN